MTFQLEGNVVLGVLTQVRKDGTQTIIQSYVLLYSRNYQNSFKIIPGFEEFWKVEVVAFIASSQTDEKWIRPYSNTMLIIFIFSIQSTKVQLSWL